MTPDETEADLIQALAHALRYAGRKRMDTAGELVARITAERLVEHLKASGFVVMKKAAPRLHSAVSAPSSDKDNRKLK